MDDQPEMSGNTNRTVAQGDSQTLGSLDEIGAVPALEIHVHELLRRIGRGSFGEVWLARNMQGKYRAVKIVYRGDAKRAPYFELEYRGLERTEPISRTHIGLADILQIGRNNEQGYFYYVMEAADDRVTGREIQPESYVPRTLSSELANRGRLPVNECRDIGLALAAVLDYFHNRGLVHCDAKPENVIFVNGLPVLADVGLVAEAGKSFSGGTEGYIPPEGHGSPQGDIYSLGKLLYQISTGIDPRQFPKLPGELTAVANEKFLQFQGIIQKACADIDQRYKSAHELHSTLMTLQENKQSDRRGWTGRFRGFKVQFSIAITLSCLVLALLGISELRRTGSVGTLMPASASIDETAASATALPADPAVAPAMMPASPEDGSLTRTPVTLIVTSVRPVPVAKTYIVKKGDTIAKIAKTQGTTQVELARVNHLTKTSILKIGQKLTIPHEAEATDPQTAVFQPGILSAAVTTTVYIVKSGDSLWMIAKAYNISVATLKQVNNLSSDALKVNQTLTIPATARTIMPAGQTNTLSPSNTDLWQLGTHTENGQSIHTVDIGESLAIVANKYGLNVEDLMKANDLTDTNRIMVGQKLIIPVVITVPAQ